MSKRVNFAETFQGLYDFPNCTSTTFIEPIDETTMGKKLDKHLVVLEAEFITANGDSNRRRKLQSMYSETNSWAAEVETGKNKFFRVGFVFSLYAKSLEDLTKQSDSFRHIARDKGLDVSACSFVQSEAYIANSPKNRYFGGQGNVNSNDGKVKILASKVTGVTITPVKANTIKAGTKLRLKTTVKTSAKYEDANTKLKWSSSDPKVATVSKNGVVKAKKAGRVTITASSTDGSRVKAKIKLKVIKK